MREQHTQQLRRPRFGRARRRFWAAAAALAVTLTLLTATPPRPVQAQPVPTTVTFAYTGAAQTWTVPPGVTSATFAVSGAQGGRGCFNAAGGLGGTATATLAVTPGQTLQITVGGQGGAGVCFTGPAGASPGAGGFNGGGSGGSDSLVPGGGGGGASDVRTGGFLPGERRFVGGGGGGGGSARGDGGAGGGNGGVTGTAGASSQGGPTGGAGGAGAAAISAGSGGAGGSGSHCNGNGGVSGSGTTGGAGASAAGCSGGSAGGGGGGGYFGGGGGGQGGVSPILGGTATAGGGGGGGGGGLGPVGVVFETGVRQGHGLVTITYIPPAPTVTSISPNRGPATGGTTVTITGANFSTTPGATAVAFGSNAAPAVSCASSTTCTATSPAGTGTASVRVTVGGQQSADTAADDFTYVPAPTLAGLSPTSGPVTGGTVVTLTGTGFVTTSGGTTVTFGSVAAASVNCTSSTSCQATSPAGTSVGSVQVTIITADGTSNGVPFTYGPAVTRISPTAGPFFGGTTVTITGGGFSTTSSATTVQFGATPATTVSCPSTTSCTALAPAGNGTVSVRVTVGGQQSADTPADDYTYLTPDAAAMRISGTVFGVSSPVVRALVGSTVCGQATADAAGNVSLQVFAASQVPGCGTNGAPLAFTLTGTPATATPAVSFQSGGSAFVKLVSPSPPAGGSQPLAVGGTAFTTVGQPAPVGSVVQALVGGVPCGSAKVGQGGTFQLSVASAAQAPGCGVNSAAVSFTLNGKPAVPAATFTSGGSITVQIVAAGP